VEVTGQGVSADKTAVHVHAYIRYAGTDTPLIVDAGHAKILPPPLRGRSVGFADREGGIGCKMVLRIVSNTDSQ